MTFPPVVYAGPSIAADEVQRHLPGAQLMPPVARGDLYRDRTLGFGMFVILDGVFSQQLAIPPREVIDVLTNGACVIGASSMGAIRAAECWPAGMQGVGTIYRLFRRGSLESDDEVALTFMEEQGYRIASVPLINIRFSVARHLRQGKLSADQGKRIVDAAIRTHYAERNWRALLDQADVEDNGGVLRQSLAACDLKRADAVRALRRTAQRLRESPELSVPATAVAGLFLPGKDARERSHYAADGIDQQTLRTSMWQWLLASGRYRQIRGLKATVDLKNPQPECPDALLQELLADPAADSLIYRYRALQYAAIGARDNALSPDRQCLRRAEASIAEGHGLADWESLTQAFGGGQKIWRLLEHLRQDLAQAIAFKVFADNKPELTNSWSD